MSFFPYSLYILTTTFIIIESVHSSYLGLLKESFVLSVRSSTLGYSFLLSFAGEDSRETDEAVKELEHALLQNTLDKEMHELNKRLEQKEVSFL